MPSVGRPWWNSNEAELGSVNGWHNLVHIASGLVGLALFRRNDTARLYALGFGAVYLLVTIIGFADGAAIGAAPAALARGARRQVGPPQGRRASRAPARGADGRRALRSALFTTPGDHPALVRFSRSIGLPSPLHVLPPLEELPGALDALRFSPFTTGGGLEPTGALNRMRAVAYPMSQASWRRSRPGQAQRQGAADQVFADAF